MNAYPSLDKRQFDLTNMSRGINSKDIYKIAARCRVPIKDGVLPMLGYKDCLSYVEKHANNPSEVDEFIKEWKRTAHQTEKAKARTIQRNNEPKYNRVVKVFREKEIGHGTIILTFSHWWDLTEAEHNERVHELYTNTYLGRCAVKPPVVRFDPEIYAKRTEIWEVKAKVGDEQDERQTMGRWNTLYSICCRKCGYEPKL